MRRMEIRDDPAVCRMPMLELFEMVQRILTIEQLDVARLRRSQTTNSPAQVYEVRLERRSHRMHSDLVRKRIRLASVARAACSHDVSPIVRSAT